MYVGSSPSPFGTVFSPLLPVQILLHKDMLSSRSKGARWTFQVPQVLSRNQVIGRIYLVTTIYLLQQRLCSFYLYQSVKQKINRSHVQNLNQVGDCFFSSTYSNFFPSNTNKRREELNKKSQQVVYFHSSMNFQCYFYDFQS